MWWLRQLFRPFDYILVYQPGSWLKNKRMYDIILPSAAALVLTILYVIAPSKPAIIGDKGIFEDLQQLLSLLTAFFIAALAAIATFQRESLDKPVRGTPAYIKRHVANQVGLTNHLLTRRQLYCYLFGYLSIMSLVLFLIVMAMNVVWPHVPYNIDYQGIDIRSSIEFVGVMIVSFLFSNIMINTIIGIYGLMDRIQD